MRYILTPYSCACQRVIYPWFCGLLVLSADIGGALRAEPWPQWRGPHFNGSAPGKAPTSFSATSNVLWSAALPGRAAATPAIWQDHVFVSSTDEAAQALVALALDARTGEVRWRREIAPGIQRDDRSNFAGPSPLTDGERVWFYYSTGELVAFDFSGRELWRRNVQKDYGEFAFLWTFSSSPLLFDGRLYLQVLQRDVPAGGRGRRDGPNDSYLLALDPATGRELWRQVRPSEAKAESREAYSTPIPLPDAPRPEILVTGGDCFTGHDPATGRELWRWGTWNPERITHWRLVPSPVSGGGRVLACAPKGGPVFALPYGLDGAQPDERLAWKSTDREISCDVPTPLFHAGRFYFLNGNRHRLSAVEPASGRVLWSGELESTAVFDASPTAAGDAIYCINQKAEVFVVGTGDTFEIRHRATLGEGDDRAVRSSIAIADGRLYIRTDKRLYCIGSKP